MKEHFYKVIKKINKLICYILWKPIPVYVFHAVSDVFDPVYSCEEDWTSFDNFKKNIEFITRTHTFIPLSKAQEMLSSSRIRFKRYAVLTSDDGLQHLLNVIPWLTGKNIPITLFVNGLLMQGNVLKPIHEKYLDENYPDVDKEKIKKKMYLTQEQLLSLCQYNIEIGLHGYRHLDAVELTAEQFDEEVSKCEECLSLYPKVVRFYAFPWGRYSQESLNVLKKRNLIPVLVDGKSNVFDCGFISRICLDNKLLFV